MNSSGLNCHMGRTRCFRYGRKILFTGILAVELSIFNFQFSLAQSETISYARHVIDTLTSITMNGRGYVDSADFKAATFIRNEFKNDSLLPFTNSYFQYFFFDANVFPGKMNVTLGNNALTPGKEIGRAHV